MTCVSQTRWVSGDGAEKAMASVHVVRGDDERSKNMVEVENAAALKNGVMGAERFVDVDDAFVMGGPNSGWLFSFRDPRSPVTGAAMFGSGNSLDPQ